MKQNRSHPRRSEGRRRFLYCLAAVIVVFMNYERSSFFEDFRPVSKSFPEPLPFISWLEENLWNCPILYHIHIPKTGGTSISSVLRNAELLDSPPGGTRKTPIESKNAYVGKGKHLNSSLFPYLEKQLLSREEQTKLSPQKRTQPIVVSLEQGINELQQHGYPYFHQTCFFTTVREPSKWLHSAANHLTLGNATMWPGEIYGTKAYLDLDNVQSAMAFGAGVSYDLEESMTTRRTAAPRSSKPLPPPSPVCLYTTQTINDLLGILVNNKNKNTTSNRNGASDNTRGSQHGTILGHENSRAYIVNATQEELDDVVQRRYWMDQDLWYNVTSHQGKLCFGVPAE